METSTNRSTMAGYSLPQHEEGMEYQPSIPKSRFVKIVKNVVKLALVIIYGLALVFICNEIRVLKDKISSDQESEARKGITEPLRQVRGLNPEAVQPGAGWNAPASCMANNTPLIHVTHITSGEVKNGDWFSWHSDEEEGYEELSSRHMLFRNNKFIEITQPGWYFIYSQLTYNDYNWEVIGHEVVRKVGCGEGEARILLSSRMHQTETTYPFGFPTSPMDSGYLGGVFYFSANDFVGVRPLSDSIGRETIKYASNNKPLETGSYFGAFMLAQDSKARVADIGECCDSSILLK